MMRLAILFVVVAACSGKSKPGPTTGGTGSGSAYLAKMVHVTWGITQQASGAEVFLQTTDETGRQVSHPLGSFEGQCSVITPAADMKAVSGVSCKTGGISMELHAVVREPDIIVLKLRVDEGITPDPMAREEVTRVRIPTGAGVDAG